MTAFKIILLVILSLSGIGSISSKDFARYSVVFLLSGVLYIAALVLELIAK